MWQFIAEDYSRRQDFSTDLRNDLTDDPTSQTIVADNPTGNLTDDPTDDRKRRPNICDLTDDPTSSGHRIDSLKDDPTGDRKRRPNRQPNMCDPTGGRA